MSIHKSYSKQDLIRVMSEFNIKIDNYTNYNKSQLVSLIEKYIAHENDISFTSTDIYSNIKDKDQLINMLNNPNCFKPLSVKDKYDVMQFCKDIIHYSRHGYILENTNFNSREEIVLQMDDLLKYGDIPSLRRACRLLSADPYINKKFVPIISPYMERIINDKKIKKIKKINGLIVRTGGFVVVFN